MKNITKFILLAFFSIFISCNNDDEVENKQSNNIERDIIGKWVPYQISVNNNAEPYTHENCSKDYLEFKSDLSYRYVDIINCIEDIENGTYIINANENKIKIINGFISRDGFVRIYLSPEKVLTIEFNYDYNEDGINDSVVTYYKFQN